MTIPNWKPTYPQPIDEQYTTGWSDDPETGVENLIPGERASELAKSFDRKNRRYPANIPKGLKEISRVSTSLDDTTFKVKYNCKYIRCRDCKEKQTFNNIFYIQEPVPIWVCFVCYKFRGSAFIALHNDILPHNSNYSHYITKGRSLAYVLEYRAKCPEYEPKSLNEIMTDETKRTQARIRRQRWAEKHRPKKGVPR